MLTRKYRVLSSTNLRRIFGSFNYTNNRDKSGRYTGAITIEKSWVQDNIVPCVLTNARDGKDVKTYCHRLAKPAFEAVFAAIHDQGLSKLIHTWDGLWVPRHKVWNVENSLSSHSWGIATDINAATNPYGGRTTPENNQLAEVFVEHGFDYGGFWDAQICDAMHYELVDPNAHKDVKGVKFAPQLVLAVKRPNGTLQYVTLQTDQFVPGAFTVNITEIAALLNVPYPNKPTRIGIDDALKTLGWERYDTGDHLDDTNNPRVYLFVQPKD